MDDLTDIVKAIENSAKERGFLIYPDLPNLSHVPVASWQGDWQSFLDFASQAKVDMLYLRKECLNMERSVQSIMTQAGFRFSGYNSNRVDAEALFNRILEHVGKFKAHDGKKELDRQAQAALADAEHQRLHALADQMVQNERFTEAKSEAKRSYMASQLFPAESHENHILIAELAFVIHWWHYEPDERAAKMQKAKELYSQGVSPKYVAGLLQMPEAQVMLCITTSRKDAKANTQGEMEL